MSTPPHSTIPVILGIDPGTRYMGIVVLQGKQLMRYGVHQLRNGERPHDVIGQAKRIVLGYIGKHGPQIVAIETPLPMATRRGAILNVIVDELRARAKDLNLELRELGPSDIRVAVVGDPKATKIDVAETLVNSKGFDALRPLIPRRPTRSALGLRSKDKYWLHMFDALAVAVGVRQ